MNTACYKPTSFNSLLDSFFDVGFSNSTSTSSFTPNVDVIGHKDSFELRAELPGFKKEDIKISVEDGILSFSGERKETLEEGSKYHLRERSFGKFARKFRLSSDLNSDSVSAKFNDGVLSITLQRKPESQPKEITIE